MQDFLSSDGIRVSCPYLGDVQTELNYQFDRDIEERFMNHKAIILDNF